MRTLISILLLVSLPAIVGYSAPTDLATERRAAIIATNAALAVSAPVSNLAANAQSLALDALARPGGVSTDYVNDAVAPVAVLATNAYDLAGTAVRTNSSHSIQIGTESFALANYSFAFGYLVTASGIGSRAFGYNSTASGHYSTADGSGCTASGTGSMAFGQMTTASAGFATAFGRATVASGVYSLAIGSQAIAADFCSFVWNGYGEEPPDYCSHGDSTFNINPVAGPSGFYIGETNLQTFLDARISVSDFASSNATTSARIDGLAVSNAVNANYISALEGSNAANFILSSCLYESNAVNVAAIDTKPSAESVTNAVFYRQIVSSVSAITSTVSVVPSVSIYRLTATNSTTITFDTSALNTTNQLATWELWVLNASTNNSIIWPSTNSVYYIASPSSISANSQTVYTVWRKFGDTVQCNPYLVK